MPEERLIVCFLPGFSGLAYAQGVGIIGTVTDPSGAVIELQQTDTLR